MPNQLIPDSSEQTDSFSREESRHELNPNQAPKLISLEPDNPGPQEEGSSIRWTANAQDPENDPIFYQFKLKGPSTGGEWTTVNAWSEERTWNWNTAPGDAGRYQIMVSVRDQANSGPGSIPDEKEANYQIIPQKAPSETESVVAAAEKEALPVAGIIGQQASEIEQQAAMPVEAEYENQAPTMLSLISIPSSPQDSGTPVTWTASASDLEGDGLEFQFMVDGKPVTDWQFQNQWVMDTALFSPGTHSVAAKVKDGSHSVDGDDSKESGFAVNKPNEPPVITDFSPDKTSPNEVGTIINWMAKAGDVDDDPVLYRFFLNGQPASAWQSQGQWSWKTTEANVGDNQVEVRIVDSKHASQDGFDDSRSAQFVIAALNQVPAVDSFEADQVSPQDIGSIIIWTAKASDAEKDPILYRFFLNGQPASAWQSQGQWSWKTTEANVGDNQVEVRIVDSKHASQDGFDDSRSVEFAINAPAPVEELTPVAAPIIVAPAKLNESPIISSLVADVDSPQLLGTPVTWTAEASDPESDPIFYRFLVNDSPVTGWQSQNQWTFMASKAGTSEIKVQAKDDQHDGPQGIEGNKTAQFAIDFPAPEEELTPVTAPIIVAPAKFNESPIISSLVADVDSPQLLGTPVTWTAEASDPESDPILYRFLVNDSPVTDWQQENQLSWQATEPGNSQISVQVKDGQHENPQGREGNRSARFTINAPAPEIEPAEAPSEANVTETVNETEQIAPPIITPEVVTPEVAENITAPSAMENLTRPEVVVNKTEAEAAAPIAENQTPIINSLVPDLASPQRPGAVIIWTASGTDADQDPLLFRFLLSGPATGGAWQAETEWSSANTWAWSTSSVDAGSNQIKAQVRDGKHASEDGFDGELFVYFTLSEPARNISGNAFEDKNGNVLMDNGEALAGWMIQLVKPDKSQVSTITREDGSYLFEQLEPETYAISIELPSGWKSISPESGSYSVDLREGDAKDRNFANRMVSYSIEGMKFSDLNGNGVNDGEPGMEGWTIQLSKDGQTVNSTTTSKDGTYRFTGLQPGSYSISEVDQSGWIRTAPKEGSYSIELKDSDVTALDFGNHGSWAVSGTSFTDTNGNGARDGDEIGRAGSSIQLLQSGNIINATTTGQDGSYVFRSLAPGMYTVAEVAQEGWTWTLPEGGSYSVELKDSDVSGKDFGSKGGLAISGVKFYDSNENGVQDSDEPSIPGQPVTLVQNGKIIANVTSGEDGSYEFANLAPGTYEVDDPIVVSVTTVSTKIAPIPIVGTSTISGLKFNDKNGNGIKDGSESGIANWEIALTYVGHAHGPAHEIIIAKAKTDANGAYSFKRLFPGVYKVSEFSQLGWTPTTAPELTVTLPGSKSNQNFGNKLVTETNKASIWGVKFNDVNGNGINNGEQGLSGWTITLKNLTSSAVLTTTTNANGWYSFTNLTPGSYQLSEVIKSGWTPVAPAGGIYSSFSLVAGDNKEFNFANKNNNLPPTIQALTANKASPQMVDQAIVLSVNAMDPENDPLQYRFIIKGPAPSSQVRADTGYMGSSTWTWSAIGYVPGDYQVEVWVRDGLHSDPNGFDAKKSITYKLTSGNRPPRVNVLYSDRPAPQYVGSWIRWTAIASDPEGDQLQYKFYLRGPSTSGFWIDQTGWGKNNRWIWRTSLMDVGYSEVLVAVRDGKHAGPSRSDDYEVAEYLIINLNEPPAITGLATNVRSPQSIGSAVLWSASSMDLEGDRLFFRYWIKGPATRGVWRLARDWSTDPTWLWLTSLADAGTSEVQVQIRDGMHASPAEWDDDAGGLFTVLRPNSPPKLISLKSDKPSSQKAGTAIKWTASSTDPDRDLVLYRFWLKGQSTGNAWKIVQDWSTKNQWTWANAPKDAGAYSVYVYARDGKHAPATGYDSALGASYVLLASNQLPKLTSLVPDKASPKKAGTTVKWTAKATDANRDQILYRFWLKGPSTGNNWKIVQDWSSKGQWTWTNAPTNPGVYNVYVFVRDGKHAPATGYDGALGQNYMLLRS